MGNGTAVRAHNPTHPSSAQPQHKESFCLLVDDEPVMGTTTHDSLYPVSFKNRTGDTDAAHHGSSNTLITGSGTATPTTSRGGTEAPPPTPLPTSCPPDRRHRWHPPSPPTTPGEGYRGGRQRCAQPRRRCRPPPCRCCGLTPAADTLSTTHTHAQASTSVHRVCCCNSVRTQPKRDTQA